MGVVKANAYGHGLLPVSRFLEDQGLVEYLGVAITEEAVHLRDNGISLPILIFNSPLGSQILKIADHSLEISINSLEDLRRIIAAKSGRVIIHLELETGMNRTGIQIQELQEVLKILNDTDSLELRGVFTHFTQSEIPGDEFTLDQIRIFKQMSNMIDQAGFHTVMRHIANSAAVYNNPDIHYDIVRPGIMTYGYYPRGMEKLSNVPELKIPLEWKTQILETKRIKAGESVSYGRRFVTKRDTTIATLPLGYADGLSRSFSNKGEVLIHGKKYPLAGTICMDLCMVDLGDDWHSPETEVYLIHKDRSLHHTASDLAEMISTISYEILCGISSRVPRLYLNNKE